VKSLLPFGGRTKQQDGTPSALRRPEQTPCQATNKLGQLSDPNVPIPNFLAMVLETNAALRQLREAGQVLELALSNQFSKLRAIQLVFDNLTPFNQCSP
jgi:hypothetical protein